MFSGLRASITSPPSTSAFVVLRANTAMSPIQLKMSRSRSIPYCDCSCAVAAAPPNAPATCVKMLLTEGPTSAAPIATHASPGSSPSSGVLPVPVSGPSAFSALTPGPCVIESNAIRSLVGQQRAGDRVELVDREDRADLLELLRGLRVGLERLLDERLEVDVELPDPVVVEPVDRLLVLLRLGERVAVLRLDRALELGLGADREEVADDPGRHAVVVHLVVDAGVGALLDLAAVGLDALVDRLLRRLGVLGRDDHDVARLLLVDAGDPDAGLLAQPRRDVVLVRRLGVGIREALVDQLAQLGLGIVRAQDLASGVEHVLALVALGAHDALEVDRRAGRNGAGGLGAGGAATAAAGGERRGVSRRAGRAQQERSRHRTEATDGASELQSGVQGIALQAVLPSLGAGDHPARPTAELAQLQGKRARKRTR